MAYPVSQFSPSYIRKGSQRHSTPSQQRPFMDAEEDTEKLKKIRELHEIVARGRKGINNCRLKGDCPFARQCPGIC
jgi:hypothetical protein